MQLHNIFLKKFCRTEPKVQSGKKIQYSQYLQCKTAIKVKTWSNALENSNITAHINMYVCQKSINLSTHGQNDVVDLDYWMTVSWFCLCEAKLYHTIILAVIFSFL